MRTFEDYILDILRFKRARIADAFADHMRRLRLYGCLSPQHLEKTTKTLQEMSATMITIDDYVPSERTEQVMSHFAENNSGNEAYKYCVECIPEILKPFRDTVLRLAAKIMNSIGYWSVSSALRDVFDIDDPHMFNDPYLQCVDHFLMPVSIVTVEKNNDRRLSAYALGTGPSQMVVIRRLYELDVKDTIRVTGFIPSDLILDTIEHRVVLFPVLSEWWTAATKKLDDYPISKQYIKYIDEVGDLQDVFLGMLSDNERRAVLFEENKQFLLYTRNTFMNNMKIFVDKQTSTNVMFTMIYYLLIGNQENINVANLLLGMLKDKGAQGHLLYSILLSNISPIMKKRLSESDQDIEEEYTKIKELTVYRDVDFKQQVVLHRTMPDNIKAVVLDKIEEMKTPSSDYYKQHLFVTTLLQFPWAGDDDSPLGDIYDMSLPEKEGWLRQVRINLNGRIFGHLHAKDMIMYYLAKWIVNKDSRGGSFALVGPPGVGKTLFVQSLSDALHIPFSQITLGGQNDGELLHGHGYTYSGSSPGLIIKKVCEAGSTRCVLFFDELDKCSSRSGGVNEIMSILIHLTDPNMNRAFQDRFFKGIDFPLDRILVAVSYNDPSKIDPILLDRLTEINVKGFNRSDKLKIATDYIIPDLCQEIGINANTVVIEKKMLEYIINEYTNEAGVRSLRKALEKIYLHANYQKLLKNLTYAPYVFDVKLIDEVLMIDRIPRVVGISHASIGMVYCLYVNHQGGCGVCTIQVIPNFVKDTGLRITGNVGKLMIESIQCSLTAAWNHVLRFGKSKYNIKPEELTRKFPYGFHVHVMDTSIPKDGPSAGAAYAVCFISNMIQKPIRELTAISCEIDVCGNLLRVGAIEQKLEAAKLNKMKTVFMSSDNREEITRVTQNLDLPFEPIMCEHLNELCDILFAF